MSYSQFVSVHPRLVSLRNYPNYGRAMPLPGSRQRTGELEQTQRVADFLLILT
jgi:hypothetical protein